MSGRALLFLIALLAFVIIQPSRANPCKRRVKTRHQQCVDHGYDVACEPGTARMPHRHNECTLLMCGRRATTCGVYKFLFVFHQPLEYTECGKNKICLHKRCIKVSESEMPEQVGSTEVKRCWSRVHIANMLRR